MEYKVIDSGVTAPPGFRAAGIHCGIRKNTEKKDLALIVADCDCTAAAVYTTNRVKASPLNITKRHLENGRARAILANSGNANACAAEGEQNAMRSCRALAQALNISERDVIVNSTGVIGQRLPVERIEEKMPELVKLLGRDQAASDAAAHAIMTTDTTKKDIAVSFLLDGKAVKLGAIAKGSGMIHPNMATMLAFITTDCAISSEMLETALKDVVKITFNRVSVDGDTSTNDMAAIMASGLAGNRTISEQNADYDVFFGALSFVCKHLAKELARDGEGATRLVTCHVKGAACESDAEKLSMSVTSSSLVKTAMFGADANIGRVLCAMGYSGIEFEPGRVNISYHSDGGTVSVCRGGLGLEFDETLAKAVLSQQEILIDVELGMGSASAETYGCDLTYDYVKINGDYRT